MFYWSRTRLCKQKQITIQTLQRNSNFKIATSDVCWRIPKRQRWYLQKETKSQKSDKNQSKVKKESLAKLDFWISRYEQKANFNSFILFWSHIAYKWPSDIKIKMCTAIARKWRIIFFNVLAVVKRCLSTETNRKKPFLFNFREKKTQQPNKYLFLRLREKSNERKIHLRDTGFLYIDSNIISTHILNFHFSLIWLDEIFVSVQMVLS